MTNVLLPTPAFSQARISPLARYFQSAADLDPIAVDLVPAILEGGAAIAATVPFDPNETTTSNKPFRFGEIPRTLLDNVLTLQPHWMRSVATQPWPTDPAGFSEALFPPAGPSPFAERLTPEHLAAQLLAAGANPWLLDGHPRADVAPAVVTAMSENMSFLVQRFLQTPQAPDPQDLMNRPVQGIPLWQHMVRENAHRSLMVAVQHGFRLEEDKAWETTMGRAKAESVEPLVVALRKPSSAAARARIRKEWDVRLKEKDITPEAMVSMVGVLEPESPVLSAAQPEIQQLLATAWGTRPNGSKAMAYDFENNRGAEALLAEGTMEAGPFKGHWTVLAAMVMARMKAADDDGARPWDAKLMVDRQTPIVDVEGCLKSVLGQEWQPGISLDGVLMLGLVGQAVDGQTLTIQSVGQCRQKWHQTAATFAALAGVSDLQAWMKRSVGDAVAFTCAVLNNPTSRGPKPAEALLACWKRALAIHENLLDPVPLEQRYALLRSLTGRFEISSKNSWQGLVETFGNPGGSTEKEDDLHMATVLSLMTQQSQPLIADLERDYPRFTPAIKESINQWMAHKKRKDPGTYSQMAPLLRQWELDKTLPESQPTAAKPRF